MSEPSPHNPFEAPATDAFEPPTVAQDGDLPATRGSRFAGALIDNLVYLLPLIVAAAGESNPAIVGLGWGGLLMLVALQSLLVAWSGQSIGKKVMRTCIVRMDGSPAGFLHGVLLRSWLPLLAGLIPYIGGAFGLVDALLIFGADSRCIHDHVAGTKVMDLRMRQEAS